MNLNDLIGYVIIGLGLVSLITGYIAKYDNKHKDFWTDLHNGADAIVAELDVVNMSNNDKKTTSTNALIKQMGESGHKHITKTVAQGAIEQAVKRRTPDSYTVNIDTQPVIDEINKVKPVFQDMKAGE